MTDLCVSEMQAMQMKMQRPNNYKEFEIVIIDIGDHYQIM